MKSARSLVLSVESARLVAYDDGTGRVTGTAVAADAACERFTLDFQLARGCWQRELLSSCRGTRFEEALPARPFRFEKGLRNFAGWWYFATTAAHVGFESWLERDHLM